jgi:hypothetical protein
MIFHALHRQANIRFPLLSRNQIGSLFFLKFATYSCVFPLLNRAGSEEWHQFATTSEPAGKRSAAAER